MNVSWSSEKRSLWIIVSKVSRKILKDKQSIYRSLLSCIPFLHEQIVFTNCLYRLSSHSVFILLHPLFCLHLKSQQESPMAKFSVFNSLVRYNMFRTILSLNFIPPLVSGSQYTCEKCLLIFPYILVFLRVQSSALLYFCSL